MARLDINLGDTVYGVSRNVGSYPGLLFSRWTGELNPFAGIDVGDNSVQPLPTWTNVIWRPGPGHG